MAAGAGEKLRFQRPPEGWRDPPGPFGILKGEHQFPHGRLAAGEGAMLGRAPAAKFFHCRFHRRGRADELPA